MLLLSSLLFTLPLLSTFHLSWPVRLIALLVFVISARRAEDGLIVVSGLLPLATPLGLLTVPAMSGTQVGELLLLPLLAAATARHALRPSTAPTCFELAVAAGSSVIVGATVVQLARDGHSVRVRMDRPLEPRDDRLSERRGFIPCAPRRHGLARRHRARVRHLSDAAAGTARGRAHLPDDVDRRRGRFALHREPAGRSIPEEPALPSHGLGHPRGRQDWRSRFRHQCHGLALRAVRSPSVLARLDRQARLAVGSVRVDRGRALVDAVARGCRRGMLWPPDSRAARPCAQPPGHRRRRVAGGGHRRAGRSARRSARCRRWLPCGFASRWRVSACACWQRTPASVSASVSSGARRGGCCPPSSRPCIHAVRTRTTTSCRSSPSSALSAGAAIAAVLGVPLLMSWRALAEPDSPPELAGFAGGAAAFLVTCLSRPSVALAALPVALPPGAGHAGGTLVSCDFTSREVGHTGEPGYSSCRSPVRSRGAYSRATGGGLPPTSFSNQLVAPTQARSTSRTDSARCRIAGPNVPFGRS